MNIVEQSALMLRALIGRRELSPVELVEACLSRISEINPAVNAVVALDEERARAEARLAEEAAMSGTGLGPLHGLPVLVKDLTATAGLTTTRGSLALRDNVPGEDDLVVARLRAAGAIILGKTNTPEFGSGSNTVNRVYGATVNPFDPCLSSAGSSGGTAVALASDMVPLATGTDMGGSVRTPASFCGVVGHRASAGAIANPGRAAGWSTLSVDGPMAREVADAALLMSAMAGPDPRDPLSLDLDPRVFSPLPPSDPTCLKVAFSEDLGVAPVSKAVRQTFGEKAGRLAPLFARAEWRDPGMEGAHHTFETLRGLAYIEAYDAWLEEHRDLASVMVADNVASAREITVEDAARAMAGQTAIYRRLQTFFEEFDFLICPSASVLPFPVEQLWPREIDGETMATYITWISITYAISLTGHPVTVIPCGLGPTGMPFGLQIVGPARGDLKTLSAAAAIEAALAGDPDLARPRPDIAALLARKADSKAGLIPEGLKAAP